MALGLEAVRDALLLAYNESIIDDEEFALLYDYNQSKPLYPYWIAGMKLNVRQSYDLRKKIWRHLWIIYKSLRNLFVGKYCL